MNTHFEYRPPSSGPFEASDVVAACIENGHYTLLLDSAATPPELFDLSTGIMGDLVRRLTLYRIRMAVVVPDPARCSRPFQDFMREANRGEQFRFFRTREEAVAWLDEA